MYGNDAPTTLSVHIIWASHSASIDVRFRAYIEVHMRTTINLDDQLLNEALQATGLTERTAVIHEGLKALIARDSAQRLARLAGSERRLRSVPRRRTGRQ
ncbi:MAG: type II toxin-antitoxin system VapB family antitoxin [Burkholderiaceae bacterium]